MDSHVDLQVSYDKGLTVTRCSGSYSTRVRTAGSNCLLVAIKLHIIGLSKMVADYQITQKNVLQTS